MILQITDCIGSVCLCVCPVTASNSRMESSRGAQNIRKDDLDTSNCWNRFVIEMSTVKVTGPHKVRQEIPFEGKTIRVLYFVAIRSTRKNAINGKYSIAQLEPRRRAAMPGPGPGESVSDTGDVRFQLAQSQRPRSRGQLTF